MGSSQPDDLFVLVRWYGETSWTAALLPVSVDGMIVASGKELAILDHLLAPMYIRVLFGVAPVTPAYADSLVDRLLADTTP